MTCLNIAFISHWFCGACKLIVWKPSNTIFIFFLLILALNLPWSNFAQLPQYYMFSPVLKDGPDSLFVQLVEKFSFLFFPNLNWPGKGVKGKLPMNPWFNGNGNWYPSGARFYGIAWNIATVCKGTTDLARLLTWQDQFGVDGSCFSKKFFLPCYAPKFLHLDIPKHYSKYLVWY